jgi:opacity protein-like surface antigen
LHTDLTYNLNSWFGLEGNVVSACGGAIGGERTKYVLYAAGGRIGWGPSRNRFSPWAHALVGGVHLNPQVAGASKNTFALQAGGGVDWAYNPRVSLRAEADYVRSTLYSSTQNNFQIGLGAVIHF